MSAIEFLRASSGTIFLVANVLLALILIARGVFWLRRTFRRRGQQVAGSTNYWIEIRRFEITMLMLASGLVYLCTTPDPDIWCYIIAFAVVPLVFKNCLVAAQSVLRHSEVSAAIKAEEKEIRHEALAGEVARASAKIEQQIEAMLTPEDERIVRSLPMEQRSSARFMMALKRFERK